MDEIIKDVWCLLLFRASSKTMMWGKCFFTLCTFLRPRRMAFLHPPLFAYEIYSSRFPNHLIIRPSLTRLYQHVTLFSLNHLFHRPFSAAASAAKDAHHHDDGHHGHHDHRVFHPEEWNPFGAPLAILLTVVGGGTAIIVFAVKLQLSKWTPPS